MDILKLSKLAQFCGVTAPAGLSEVLVTDISIDTRTLKRGALFVPIIGDRFDGHDFISRALESGATAALSSRRDHHPNIIFVEDTLTALQDMAESYRELFNTNVVAVTGSAGKTTTKEIIASVLSEKFNTHKTEGNLNNLIGLPLSVLRMGSQHGAAVFEMGMNNFGEIGRLSEIAHPNIAIITNIGTAHIEYLGSREGILKAKLEILQGMDDDGCLILNGDEPLLWDLRGTLPCRTLYFGIQNDAADIRAHGIEEIGAATRFKLVGHICKSPEADRELKIPTVGRHNVYNALAATAAALELKMSYEEISSGLLKFQTSGNRQNIYRRSGYTIIDDSYNANPESMRASLDVLRGMACTGKRIAVLGDMLELGRYSEIEHAKIADYAGKSADEVLLYGEHFKSACGAGVYSCYTQREELAAGLAEIAVDGDVILFKGSRGMAMEKLIEKFFGGK